MRNTEQDNLKYQKLYHWAHTLITSGVIKNMDKFPSETILQKKFGYSRQTVRTALQQLEDEGLITRVRGSGTYVSYEGSTENESRQRVGLLLSYYSDYLFPQVYDGIESALTEKGYGIDKKQCFRIDYRRFAVRVSQSKYPPVQRNSKAQHTDAFYP